MQGRKGYKILKKAKSRPIKKAPKKEARKNPEGLCYKWARREVKESGEKCTKGSKCKYEHAWSQKWWRKWAKDKWA